MYRGGHAAPRLGGAPHSPLSASAELAESTTTPGFFPVVRGIDGDTIIVDIGGNATTIRLIGVDTPETVDPRKPVECFGPEASAETKQLVDGREVRLTYDSSQGEFDKYHRTLAYVYLEDGTLLNEFLIAKGYGHEYTYQTPYIYQSEFRAAQKSAQKSQLGFWSPETCNGNTGITSHEPVR